MAVTAAVGPAEADAAARGVLLTIAYDGGSFAGFAPQPTQRTVAGELLGALRAIDPHIAEVRGVSRTDAGVHALGQCVAFDTRASLPPRGWVLAPRAHLPKEIAIRSAGFVPVGYTPRFDSAGKTYRYVLLSDRASDPFWEGRAWRFDAAFTEERVMLARSEAALALGTHDFAAFRSHADERTNTTRTITAFDVDRAAHDPRLLELRVTGTAFMHNMVRILVGAVVDVMLERRAPGAIARALASRSRGDLGITAPAHGLYLDRVNLQTEAEALWPDEARRTR